MQPLYSKHLLIKYSQDKVVWIHMFWIIGILTGLIPFNPKELKDCYSWIESYTYTKYACHVECVYI